MARKATIKIQVPTLPPGHYTGRIVRARKVRNKPRVRLTFQIDDPPTVDVEFVQMDYSMLLGRVVHTQPSEVKP